MKKIFLLCLPLCLSLASFSQLKWINPKPSGYINAKIQFINADTGFLLNTNGDLFKTADRGANWSLHKHFPKAECMSLKDSTGVIPTYDGTIYITTDNGKTWQEKQTGIFPIYPWADVVSRDTMFLVSQPVVSYGNKLYRSTDRGNTWQLINNDLGMLVYTLDFVNSKTGYGRRPGGISKTTDGGLTWEIKYGISNSSNITALKFLTPDFGYAYRESDEMLRTINGGSTWFSHFLPGGPIYDIFFVSPTVAFACGQGGTTYRTTNGGDNWSSIGPPGPSYNYDFISQFFFNEWIGFEVGHRGRIMKTIDGGNSWQPFSPTYVDVTSFSLGHTETAYATTWNNIYKSTDYGESWFPLALNVGLDYGSGSRFDHSVFFGDDTGIVTSNQKAKLYRTTNGGQSWTTLPLESPIFPFDYISGMSFPNKNTGYISLHGPLSSLYKTTNGGINWREVGNWQDLRTLHFVNDSVGYATQYIKLLRTLDSGKTWTQTVIPDFSGPGCLWFLNAKKGFVGAEHAFLKMTTDSAHTWTDVPLNNMFADILSIRFFNDTVGYFTTEDAQLFKSIDGGTKWELHASTPWPSTDINFTKDTNIIISGLYGEILRAPVAEYRIDSLKVTAGSQCNLAFSANVTSVLRAVDSIWFQYGFSGFTTTITGSPSSVLNRSVIAVASPQGLLFNTQYMLRVKILYKGNFYYSDSIHFTTPVLTVPVITANGNTLNSSANAGNQWYLNGIIISGATNQQYNAITSGLYTVQVTVNGCLSPPSIAYNMVLTAINDLTFNKILVYPNPVVSMLTIQNFSSRPLHLKLMDIQGSILNELTTNSRRQDLSFQSFSSGIYILRITDAGKKQEIILRIVKL